jgi:hypothetical protein
METEKSDRIDCSDDAPEPERKVKENAEGDGGCDNCLDITGHDGYLRHDPQADPLLGVVFLSVCML